MSLKDIMMIFAIRGRKVTMADRIAGVIFLLLCSLGVVLIGAIKGSLLLIILGGIPLIMGIIVLAILILYNLYRNRPRW